MSELSDYRRLVEKPQNAAYEARIADLQRQLSEETTKADGYYRMWESACSRADAAERQLSEAVERAEKAEGRSKDFEEQAAICAKVTEAAEAEVARLREALEPFAKAADGYDPDEGDSCDVAWAHDFTIGSLRAARAALQGEGEPKP